MRYFIYCRKSSEGEERQVLSLASQQEALAKAFGDDSGVEIVETYEESKSAMTPGRPVFAEMLRRIEAGEAEGIASWAPDRLARNSVDGGQIIYLLDRGVLRSLKFATYTFENNPQGKFMLGIMFNQSKYYSDALSENVKRGNATKVAMGWRPNRPPLGYLNCPTTRTIIPDPDLFPLVRRMFELFLTGTYTPRQISVVAEHEWGFRTPRKARSGGKPLGRSTIYRMFANPFYAGIIEWDGTTYQGRHTPIVTTNELAQMQALMQRGHTTRPSRHAFAFGGLLRCGSCGYAITAEKKTNRHGSRYVYYHCAARSRTSGACNERSIEEAELTKHFAKFLGRLALKPPVVVWTGEQLAAEREQTAATAKHIAASRAAAKSEVVTQLKELTSLRLRRLVDDEEFVSERQRLEVARLSLENTPSQRRSDGLFELLKIVERISNQAVKWFTEGSLDQKRQLLKIVCSNPILTDQKLSVEAAKPFLARGNLDDDVHLRGVGDDVRTSAREGKLLLANLLELNRLGKIEETLATLKGLERFCLGKDELLTIRSRPVRGRRPRALLPWKAAPRYRSRKLR